MVLTSSCAAIYGDNIELIENERGKFDEKCWNTSSSLKHKAYSYAKTQAERLAWKMALTQKRWQLISLNPSVVIGPGINRNFLSESVKLIKKLGDGTLKIGMIDARFGLVDVRDLAQVQYLAGMTENISGRFLVSGHDVSLPQIAGILKEKYPRYPVPKRIFPKFLMYLVGPVINRQLSHSYIKRNLGYPWCGDNTKSKNYLQARYRDLEETLFDTFNWFFIEKNE